MGGSVARVDPGVLRIYDGGVLKRNVIYYVDCRDSGRPNSYEQLLRDMLGFLKRGWQPYGIQRDELEKRLLSGLAERAYQDTWLWELSAARLSRQAGFGTFGSNLPQLVVEYVPAANETLLDAFTARIAAGDRPAGFIGSGGPWMYPDRLMAELESGIPGVAHKLGWLIDQLRVKCIPSYGICLTHQIMVEQTFGRGTGGSGKYLLEYLRAPAGRIVEYHERIRRYSSVAKGMASFVYGVRMIDRVHADPLMHCIDDTPALLVHGMGVKIPADRIPKAAVLATYRRFFAKRPRQIGPTTQLHKLFDESYDVLAAAACGISMRSGQHHPELTPRFCADLSFHPTIACLLTDLPPDEWPSEADFLSKPLTCLVDEDRLQRLTAMRDEIHRYPWDKFVIEPKAYDDSSPHGKRYPAGSAMAYNFIKFFVTVQYIVQAWLDKEIDNTEASMYLENILTHVQKPLVSVLVNQLGGDKLL